MVSYYNLTNHNGTSSKSARYISVDKKEFMQMDGFNKGCKL